MQNTPIEIERKYVIKKPCIDLLRSQDGYTDSLILQIYLDSAPGVTHRIRSRKGSEKTVYTETKKVRIDKMSAFEDEREISFEEFERLRASIKQGTNPISKRRITFIYRENTFEIDFYPEWNNTCILETELKSREQSVPFPDFLKIIDEVTGIAEYSNAAMAKKFPKERVL